MKKTFLFILIVSMSASANAATLTVGNIPKVNTGGSTPKLEDSIVSESAGVITVNGSLIANNIKGFTWNTISGTSQNASVNNGYIVGNSSSTTITIPSSCTVGDEIKIAGKGAGGWIIAQGSSQSIVLGNQTTTTGAGGSLASSNSRDSLNMICITTNTGWQVVGSIGNITVN